MAYLYRHTQLQENFAYNLTCLVPEGDGKTRPERLGLKAILRYFLDFRFTTVKRRFEFDLEQLRRRIHILEGFAIIFDGLDKAIRLIRESEGKADAAEKLIKAFKLDEEQVTAILDSQLYKIAQMEIQQIREELRDKKLEASRIEGILKSKAKLWGVVKNELAQVAEKFADRRRTRMATDEDVLEFDEEAYISARERQRRIDQGRLDQARRPAGEHRDDARPRGGRGHRRCSRIDARPCHLLRGRRHGLHHADQRGPGQPWLWRADCEVFQAGRPGPSRRRGHHRRAVHPGRGKRRSRRSGRALSTGGHVTRIGVAAPLSPFRMASTKNGRRYVRLAEGDKVVLANVPRDEDSMLLASRAGHVVHFPLAEVNVLSGVGKGVIGIKLGKGDLCLGGALSGNRFDALRGRNDGRRA